MPRNYCQGVYEIQNWDKYMGTKNPTYRSSWERDFFTWADRSPAVIEWGSEIIVVPYWCKVKQKKRRYMVDILIKYKNRYGDIKTEIVEIKPASQVCAPKKGRKKPSTYLEEQLTWQVNVSKWEAATKYAEERGWRFRIMTENEMYK